MKLGRALRKPWEDWAVFVAIVSSFALKLRHLGHRGLTYWDESLHARVSVNVWKHPLVPTLIDSPYLRYKFWDASQNHIWLHKPILPLWQIALSYQILGFGTMALRFPSALLSTGAVALIYLIGCELFDRRAALIGAVLLAINPLLMMEINGYVFADCFDISLLFWTSLGMYFLVRAIRTGAWRDVMFCGIAEGLGILSKSYLACIIGLVATGIYILQFRTTRLRFWHLIFMGVCSIALIAPWMLWSYVKFPAEFQYENIYVLRHLSETLEGWKMPWYRMLYYYLNFQYQPFYTPILVATVYVIVRWIVRRDRGLLFVLLWALGVIVPQCLAATKTPTATVLAMPPVFLMFGYVMSRAFAFEPMALAAMSGIGLMCWLEPPLVMSWMNIMPSGVGSMSTLPLRPQLIWVIIELSGAAVFAGRGYWILKRWEKVRYLAAAVVLATMLALLAQNVRAAFEVTSINLKAPYFPKTARYVKNELPSNAVILVDESAPGESATMSYYSFHTCYSCQEVVAHGNAGGMPGMIHQIYLSGGIPYLMSQRPQKYPAVFTCPGDDRTLYRIP